MKWIVHLEGGPRRVNHAAVCVGKEIFSFGGYSSTEEYRDWAPISIYALNTTTLRWSPVDYETTMTVPFQRYGHTTVAYGHKVYMWGGRNNTVACDALSCFDTIRSAWSTLAVKGMVPYAKDGHSACVIGNKMYTFGGFEYLSDQYSQEVHCLDLDTLNWSFVAATGCIPSHRDFHTAVAVGTRMYVFGGRGPLNSQNDHESEKEVYCPDVYYLDTVEEKWECVKANGTCPEGRRSHSAWYYEGYMYIFGGFNGNTKSHFNDLYRFSIKESTWELVHATGSIPCKRRRQACLPLDNKVYLFGGTSPCPHSKFKIVDNCDDNPERLIDSSDLHILDYNPSLKTLCMLKAIEYNQDLSSIPRDILVDIKVMTTPNRISRSVNHTG